MKTPLDPRHQKRIHLMQNLFSCSFQTKTSQKKSSLCTVKHLNDIDKKIAKSAPEWPIDKIAKIDLAILRLSVYELTVERKNPPKVIIDEAVELAKEFGNEHSAKFINGALGSILQTL